MISSLRRILLAMDPGLSGTPLLQAVASIGAGAQPVLEALLVEDAALLRLARIPVAREVAAGVPVRPVAVDRLEHQFRALAGRIRAQLEFDAGRLGLRCGFRLARGDPAEEFLQAASLADIVVLAHSRIDVVRAVSQRLPLPDLLGTGPRAVVFVQESWTTGSRVVALVAGRGGEAALEAGRVLAGREGLELSILVVASASDSEAGPVPDNNPGPVGQAGGRHVVLASLSSEVVLKAAVEEDARVLMLPAAVVASNPALVPALLRRASCSLVIVR